MVPPQAIPILCQYASIQVSYLRFPVSAQGMQAWRQ